MPMKLDVRLLVTTPDGGILLADGTLPGGTIGARDEAGADEAGDDEPAIGVVRRWLVDQLELTTPVLEVHPQWAGVPKGDPVPTLCWMERVPPRWSPPAGWTFAAMPEGAGIDALVGALPGAIQPRARELLTEIRTGAPPPDLRPRWARPGWYDRATAWMASSLLDAGRPLLDPPEPHFLRGISAVLRGRTATGDVYLKAVFPPFHAEPAITTLLAARAPRKVPRVLATETEEGWLLLDDVNQPWIGQLPARAKPAALASGIRTLIRLQRELGADVGALVGAGVPRRPLDELADELDRATGPQGMALEKPLAEDRRARAVRAVGAAVDRVNELELPTTLVHGDFHPGNAALGGDEAVIIDWSDAAIGNPVIDLVTWLAWSREAPAEREAATQAWIDAWAGPTDRAALRARIDDVLLLGGAHQVVSYDGIIAGLEPATRYTMAGAAEHYLEQLETAIARSEDLAGRRPD